MKKHRIEQIVRHEGGTARHVVQADDLSVPDCWHLYSRLLDEGRETDAKMVHETWSLCHDLLKHIRKLASRGA